MKKLILALSIAAASFTVQAEESKADACTNMAKAAGSIMEYRQSGLEMSALYQEFSKQNNDFGIAVLKDAYRIPKFSTSQYKQSAIGKFKNKWFMRCVSK